MWATMSTESSNQRLLQSGSSRPAGLLGACARLRWVAIAFPAAVGHVSREQRVEVSTHLPRRGRSFLGGMFPLSETAVDAACHGRGWVSATGQLTLRRPRLGPYCGAAQRAAPPPHRAHPEQPEPAAATGCAGMS